MFLKCSGTDPKVNSKKSQDSLGDQIKRCTKLDSWKSTDLFLGPRGKDIEIWGLRGQRNLAGKLSSEASENVLPVHFL